MNLVWKLQSHLADKYCEVFDIFLFYFHFYKSQDFKIETQLCETK